MDNDTEALKAFTDWKGYELAPLNREGRFESDWLNREFIAFRAGQARAAMQAQDPDISNEHRAEAMRAAEYLFDHSRRDLGLYILDNFNIVKDFIVRAAMQTQSPAAVVVTIGQGENRGKHVKILVDMPNGTKLYAAPPSPPPLTDEQIQAVAVDYAHHVASDIYDITEYDCAEDFFNCVRAILVQARGEQ